MVIKVAGRKVIKVCVCEIINEINKRFNKRGLVIILENIAKFTGKNLCWSPFAKASVYRFIKTGL